MDSLKQSSKMNLKKSETVPLRVFTDCHRSNRLYPCSSVTICGFIKFILPDYFSLITFHLKKIAHVAKSSLIFSK
jgi:hypothetical protein